MLRDLMDSNGSMQWVNMGMDQVMRIPMLNHKFWSCKQDQVAVVLGAILAHDPREPVSDHKI